MKGGGKWLGYILIARTETCPQPFWDQISFSTWKNLNWLEYEVKIVLQSKSKIRSSGHVPPGFNSVGQNPLTIFYIGIGSKSPELPKSPTALFYISLTSFWGRFKSFCILKLSGVDPRGYRPWVDTRDRCGGGTWPDEGPGADLGFSRAYIKFCVDCSTILTSYSSQF